MTTKEKWPSLSPANRARLGANLRTCRETLGRTQEELALAADLSRSAIGQYETGRYTPTLAALIRMENALGLRRGRLLEGIE